MLRTLITIARSSIVRWALLSLIAATVAFWTAFVGALAVMIAYVRPEKVEADPERFSTVIALPSLLAAVGAIAAIAVHLRARSRSRVREWLPLRAAMLHDAATSPSTHIARIVTPPSPEAGGHTIAVDPSTRIREPLWLPGYNRLSTLSCASPSTRRAFGCERG